MFMTLINKFNLQWQYRPNIFNMETAKFVKRKDTVIEFVNGQVYISRSSVSANNTG